MVIKEGPIRLPFGGHMRCSKCGTEGIPGKKFYAECGSPLSNRCSKCNSDNAPGAKFCGDCGSALGTDVVAEGNKPSGGWALAELGQIDQGAAEMEAGIAGFRGLGGVPRQQYAIASLARVYARMGRTENALTMLDAALAHVERSGEKCELAEMQRLRGEILLMRDGSAIEEAERCFHAAIELARVQEAKWWELRATVSLARLLAKQGRQDEARTMLADIYGWFT
jgi:tetratricopeptide (TPR) repeat protein